MADVNYIITIDDRDALKALSDMKVGFNSVGTAAAQAQQKTDTATDKIGKKVNDVDKKFKDASSSSLGFWKVAGGSAVGAIAAGAFSALAGAVGSIVPKLVEATAKYQKYAAVLTNSLGSQALARKAMEDIVKFASATPFSVDELTDSFIKYTNRGLKPTQEEMTKLGDLAATTGKDFGQLTEAVLDATTGEFERLKEFSIKASQAGDKVTLSFKNQTVVVDKNSEAIRQAIIAFGGLQGVAGSMDAISKTLGGTLSNLKDNTDQLLKVIGDVFSPVFASAAGFVSDLTKSIKDLINSEEDQIKVSVETAEQSKKEAVEGIKLLNRYEELAEKGVKATADEKEELIGITYQMRDAFGDSVVSIDKETGALLLNTEAVKSAIKQKLLLSNQEASSLALKLQNVKDTIKANEDEIKAREANIKRLQDQARKSGVSLDPTRDSQGNIVLGAGTSVRDAITAEKRFRQIALEASLENQKLKAEYLSGLATLGFNEDSASLDKLISEAEKAAGAVNKITGTNFGTGTKTGKSDRQKAIEDLEKAIESLNEKVRQSNTAQLEGFELIKAENKNALDDIDALQKKLEGLAKTAGKTLSQEVKNGLNELRQNVNENTAKEVNDLTSQIIGNAIKSSGEIYGEQLKKQQEGIENLKEGINKYYDFLEEDEVRRVGLINESTDTNLTLEEYREREILKIRLRYAQIRLNLLQNDNTTEGAARKKQAQTDIDLFQNELNKAQATTKKEKPTFMEQFLIDQFGIDESEAKKAITTAANTVSTLFNGISNLIIANTQMEIERNQKLIDSLTERVEKSKELLEIEYDNAARGSTNLLQLRQTEYDKIRIQQEQALEKQEQLRKKEIRQKLAADNLQQGSSLITSSANIIQAFSPLGGPGIVLAAVSIAAMIALFIKTRAQAYELAKESAYTGGPMTQFLNGKSDRDGQRAYVVVDENGKSVLNLGGNETIVNASASSKYKAELAAMNKGVYKHRGVGEVAESRALDIGQKQTEIVQMREQMNYDEMKRVFGEVMIGYHEDYKKYNDKKEVFIPVKDGYISKKGLHTKKVRI